jgi:hypothetical protein
MFVSKELQNLIDKMIIQVKTNSELPPFMRRQIWDKLNGNSSDKQLVRKQLTELDCICVRHVLNIWFKVFPGDNFLEHILEIVHQIVAGQIDEEEAQNLYDQFYVEIVGNRKYPPENVLPMFVGHGAVNTILTAITDCRDNSVMYAQEDEDLDPESYKPSYLTAAAYTGGLGKEGNIERHREFLALVFTKSSSTSINV